MADDQLEVVRCLPGDEQRIQALAEKIWIPTFSSILSEDRLTYLFHLMYDSKKLSQQLLNPLNAFYVLTFSGKDVGYAQLVFHKEWIKLEKLYVHPMMQGKGCGLYLLRHMISEAAAKSINELRLQVNRGNERAILFYKTFGFKIVASKDFDVGGGHVMDDYVMIWNRAGKGEK